MAEIKNKPSGPQMDDEAKALFSSALGSLKPQQNFGMGNIDLNNRPTVNNPDGTISTVRSMSFNMDGKEILVPTVSDDGRILTDDEAVDQYRRTGKYLGIFNTPQEATAYAEKLHLDQQNQYAPMDGRNQELISMAVEGTKIMEPSKGLIGSAVDFVKEKGHNASLAAASASPFLLQGAWGIAETAAGHGSQFIGEPLDTALKYVGADPKADYNPFDDLQKYAGEAAENVGKIGQTGLEIASKDAGMIERNIYSGIMSAAMNIPGIAASVMTGNPAIALGIMGAASGGISAHESMQAGNLPSTALLHGGVNAGIEVATELMPVAHLIGDLKAGSGLMKTLAHQMASEILGEQIATLAQGFADWVYLNPDKPVKEYLAQIPGDAADTLISTLAAVGLQTGVLHTANRFLGDRPAEKEAPPPSGQTSQDNADVPPPPAAPTAPTRDDLAAAVNEVRDAQQSPPAVPETTPAGPVASEPPSASSIPTTPDFAQGDVVEHVNGWGEVIQGRVDSVQRTSDGTTLQVVDQDGTFHTIFEGDGQTRLITKTEPQATRDDLAAAVEGSAAPQQIAPEQPQAQQETLELEPKLTDLPVEDLQKRLQNIRNQAKLRGWDKRLIKLRDDLEAAILTIDPNAAKSEEVNGATLDINENPTEAQKEAGNYAKGHVSIQGLNISLENAKGSIRRGQDANGTAWETTMPAHYGYVKGTTGADGDHMDVYIGDNPNSDNVFVVDQIDAETKDFDEHKAMLGFDDIQQAMDAYSQAFSDGRAEQRVGGVTIMTMAEFKDWIKKPRKSKKPLQYVKPEEQQDTSPAEAGSDVSASTESTVEAGGATNTERATQNAEQGTGQPAPQNTEQAPPRPGKVGDRLSAGEIVTTTTGRQTTPFPKVGMGSPRATKIAVDKIEQWLMQNALDEARARGDEFNARQFEAALTRPQQADKDSAELYLFDPDFVFEVPQSPLNDINTPEPESAQAESQDQVAPEAEQESASDTAEETPADQPENQEVSDSEQTPEEEPAKTSEKETAEPSSDEATKTERGKKMQDVGEKMEGKRSAKDEMADKSGSEMAKWIVDSTKKKSVFNTERREGQTEGVSRFAQELVGEIYDFSAFLKQKGILNQGRGGRWRSKTFGWEKQINNIFADDAETDGAYLSENFRMDGSLVRESRQKIADAASDYIEFGKLLNDVVEQAKTINDLKMGLKDAIDHSPEFQTLLRRFAKSYSLDTSIFSSYGKFSRITDETQKKETKRATPMVRPKLDSIERVDLKDYRKGRDVSAEEFRETFGFRGVEFGEWVNAKEGQAHVNHAFDALHDLADRLGIEPRHISLGGKLGFAFGSRGSGEHAAHYEPDTNVINLTKTKGDGSVAHEWLHALDHALRKNDHRSVALMDMAYKSLEYSLKDSDYIEKQIKRFLKKEIFYSNNKSQGPVGNARMFLNYVKTNPITHGHLGTITKFKSEGDALGKDYWGTGKELLARAWEAFILDTLHGKSPYLVSDWVEEGFVTKDAGYRGTPYPVGDERVAFNDFFDEFLKQVEFTDDGVRFKENAELPIEKQLAALREAAEEYLPKLADMMKEISDANVQQNSVQTGVSDRDGGTSAADVSRSGEGPDVAGDVDGGGGRSGGILSGDTGISTDREGDGGRSDTDSVGNDIRRDDTVPGGSVEDGDRAPTYEAKGVNHKIPVGALDETRSQKQKAKDNIDIIRLVKQIEMDQRAATPEEQSLLAKYTGWGSVKNAFPDAEGNAKEGWEDIVDQVKAELTDKEYKEARRSIQYAHYTSEIVVRGMWDALKKFGLKDGNIFEPGMGIGNFVGMMPESIKAEYSGLEIDPMTSRIAAILYPQSSVRNADFVSARYADNMFHAAIGNPPFSDTIVRGDPKYRKDNLSVHNYFFMKTIDMVAPGGVIGFVTSRYSMDSLDASARKKMAEKVDLVGAIRLPNTAFKTNAHTEVVTDIIFLRKRLPGEEGNGVQWMETKEIGLTDGEGKQHHVNEYFVDNPEMVLGNYALGGMYGKGALTVDPVRNSNLPEQIAEAVGRLPENIVTEIQKSNTAAMDMTPQEEKEGSYYLKDGALMQVDGGIGIPVQRRGKGVVGGISAQDDAKIRLLIPVRDSLRKAMSAMVARNDKDMKEAQKELKKSYDAFVKKYGPVTKSEMDSRPATAAQMEEARDELRNDYDAAGMDFDEGDIDLTGLQGRINPETGKKYTLAQIGRIRDQRKAEIEAAGGIVNEGSFDPSAVPDNVTIRYANLDAFKADPEYYNLMILENYDQETGEATTTDVFTKNIVAEVKKPEIKTPVDALNYSLATTNRVDIDLMARELNQNADAVIQELEQLDLIYRLPNNETGGFQYVYAEDYLSGAVKEKLEYAKKLASFDPEYKRNVEALEAVQPKDVPASDINTNLGSPYFDTQVITDFMREELNISATVKNSSLINHWEVDPHDPYAAENTSQYGTSKRPATDLMAHLLMKKDIRVTTKDAEGKDVVDVAGTQAAQDKARILQDKFSNWVWKSSHADRIHRFYNDTFNNIVPRKFDGTHITTAISPSIRLRPHQKNVVWRILQTGNTYMAHAVGAGKTLAMSSAGMEMRRLGLWKKPMYVVPNHMLAQFAGEFRAAYPQANIFLADEQNFHTDRRKRFVANVAKGDWDAVIMTYASFKKIPISKDFEADITEKQIEQFRIALMENGGKKSGGRKSTAARLEKQIEKMEGRLKALKAKDIDQSFTFEELGVDAILLDEAHYFRKLSFSTMQGNMKGVNPVGSKASWDLYVKSKFLDTVHPGRNLVMASGTPLTNTLAEVFTIQRYMNERALELRGINNFDAWSSVYANAVSNPERQPSGAYKVVTRLAEFMNLGSLSQMVREFMDTVTSDELGSLVDRPTLKSGSMIIKTTKPTREYLAFQKYLAHRTEEVAKNPHRNEKGADNILAIIGEGRHAAIDMRLIDPTLPEMESKLEDMIENVSRIYKETSGDTFKKKYRGDDSPSPIKGGTQLIFSDLGVRSKTKDGKSFSAYDHIKRKLVRGGVPSSEIAFISDYDTTEEKRRLQNMVNNGEIRILIGSTSKMGTGLNVQNRLKAIHNLDAPWLPADLEQRVGRGLRQGNQYKEIEVYGYGTEGSYDSTMWGMLETKAKAIIQFLKGDGDLTSMRDIEETDHYRMAKAMTSGDPRVLKQAELQSDVEKLARQANNFRSEQVQVKGKIASRKNSTEINKQLITDLEAAIKQRVEPAEGEFLMVVNGMPYTERPEASDALTKAVAGVIDNGVSTPSDGVKIGELQGFDVNMFVSNNSNLGYSYEIFLNAPGLSDSGKKWASGENRSFSGSGTITTLTNALNKMPTVISNAKRTIESNERDIKVLESQVSDEFPKQAELADKRDQLAAIEKDLHENAPIEIVYDDYPIEYWQNNKDAMKEKPSFSIVKDDGANEDGFYYRNTGRKTLKLKAPHERIQDALNKHLRKVGFPQANIVFYDPADGLPDIPNISTYDWGVYWRGIIYISMKSKDPIGTINHEMVHALKAAGAFTEAEWDRLRALAPIWRNRYGVDDTYREFNLTEAKLDEEGIAHAIQNRAEKGYVERIRNKIVRFFQEIRNFFTSKPYELQTVEDVHQALTSGALMNRKGVRQFFKDREGNKVQSVERGEQDPMFQSAWHGSPHRFDKFTLDHIGTGEGAQAYGWGLYFAGKKKVAEYYHRVLTEDQRSRISPEAKEAMKSLDNLGFDNIVEALAAIRSEVSGGRNWREVWDVTRPEDKKAADVIDAYLNKDRRGQIYEVNIPEDDVLLLWDRPFEDQAPAVQEALRKMDRKYRKTGLADQYIRTDGTFVPAPNWNGENIYNDLAKKYAKPESMGWDFVSNDTDGTNWTGHKGASLALNEAGIKGIKYEDGSSRGKDRSDKTYNYVIFDDSAIEILDTMFSRPAPTIMEDSDPMFSLSKNKNKALDQALDHLSHVRGADKSFREELGKVAAYMEHPRQVASLHESFTPVYLLSEEMKKTRDMLVHELSNMIDIYNNLKPKAKKKVDAVLEIGVLHGLNYEEYAKLAGNIVAENKGLTDARHSKDGEKITLTGVEVDAYLGVRKAMDRALDMHTQVILQEYGLSERGINSKEELQRAIATWNDETEIKRAQEALRLLQNIDDSKKRGYVPLKRWGDVGITIRSKSEDNELVWFERVEIPKMKGFRKKIIGKNKAVEKRLEELSKKFPKESFEFDTFEVNNFGEVRSKLSLNELDILAAGADISEEDYAAMREALADAQMRKGFRAHFIQSRNVPGYSEDFERAINDYVVGVSGHLARRMYAKKLDKAVGDISDSGTPRLYEYAKEYTSYITDPQEELAALRQAGFIWYLSMNVASGTTNLLQPVMVTYPWFSAMFGQKEIFSEMGSAYADVSKMVSLTQGTDVFDFSKAPKDVKLALDKANAEGDFLPLMVYDALAIANTNKAYMRGLDRKARAVQDILSITFSVPERMNRIVTYVAAYRLAMDPGNRKKIMEFINRDQIGRKKVSGLEGREFAAAFAEYAVTSTQFQMGKINRPKLARGVGTLPFQFLGFTMQSLELMHRLSTVHGGNKGRALGMMILMVVAMAGYKGIPFEDDLQEIFEALWKAITKTDLDVDTEVRKILTKYIGKTGAEIIQRGFPYALMNVDMSGRLGYGNIIPDDQPDLLGIWFDMIFVRGAKALEHAVRGEYAEALTEVSPSFIRNPAQAALWNEKGIRSASTGLPVISKENVDASDVWLKAFGWTSSSIARERARIYAEQRASNAVNNLRNEYYTRLAFAIAQSNRLWEDHRDQALEYEAEVQAIWNEIARYNEKAPQHKQINIHGATLKDRINREQFGSTANKPRKQAREEAQTLKELFGEK